MGVHPPQNGGIGYDPWPFDRFHLQHPAAPHSINPPAPIPPPQTPSHQPHPTNPHPQPPPPQCPPVPSPGPSLSCGGTPPLSRPRPWPSKRSSFQAGAVVPVEAIRGIVAFLGGKQKGANPTTVFFFFFWVPVFGVPFFGGGEQRVQTPPIVGSPSLTHTHVGSGPRPHSTHAPFFGARSAQCQHKHGPKKRSRGDKQTKGTKALERADPCKKGSNKHTPQKAAKPPLFFAPPPCRAGTAKKPRAFRLDHAEPRRGSRRERDASKHLESLNPGARFIRDVSNSRNSTTRALGNARSPLEVQLPD